MNRIILMFIKILCYANAVLSTLQLVLAQLFRLPKNIFFVNQNRPNTKKAVKFTLSIYPFCRLYKELHDR